MAHELELKLETSRPSLMALGKSSWFRELGEEAPKTRKLVSVYYDTGDRRLQSRKIALRVRSIGHRHIQTIKAPASKALDRYEWEEVVASNRPDRNLARHTALHDFTSKRRWRALRPLFETSISRTALIASEGASRIALVLDHGYIAAKRRRLAVSEVELELKEGSAQDLFVLAHKLSRKLPLALGVKSKAERGYALADGETANHHQASVIALDAALSADEGFRAIAMACLTHAAANRDAVLKDDPEGIHQMRIGLRRLRTALSLFKTLIEGPETDRIKEGLKWLSEQLGDARDFDVLLENSVKPMKERDSDNRGLRALADEVAERRAQGFAHARQVLENDRYRRIILDTALWLLGGAWSRSPDALREANRERSLPSIARDILDGRTTKLIKKLQKLDEMDARQWHKLRIAVKKLRYATGFFDGLFQAHGKRRKKFERKLKELQSALGRLNDIRMHADFANKDAARRKHAGATTKDIARAFGLGQLTGGEKTVARACLRKARRAGKTFSGLKPYWR